MSIDAKRWNFRGEVKGRGCASAVTQLKQRGVKRDSLEVTKSFREDARVTDLGLGESEALSFSFSALLRLFRAAKQKHEDHVVPIYHQKRTSEFLTLKNKSLGHVFTNLRFLSVSFLKRHLLRDGHGQIPNEIGHKRLVLTLQRNKCVNVSKISNL